MKTYHIYQADAKQAELKLRSVESQKTKVEQQLSGKNSTSRKLKGLERQAEKVVFHFPPSFFSSLPLCHHSPAPPCTAPQQHEPLQHVNNNNSLKHFPLLTPLLHFSLSFRSLPPGPALTLAHKVGSEIVVVWAPTVSCILYA